MSVYCGLVWVYVRVCGSWDEYRVGDPIPVRFFLKSCFVCILYVMHATVQVQICTRRPTVALA